MLEIGPFVDPLIGIGVFREFSGKAEAVNLFCRESAGRLRKKDAGERTQNLPDDIAAAEIFNGVDRVCDGETVDPVDQAGGDAFFGRHRDWTRKRD